jgi:chromosome segregation ATPase
LAEKNETEKNDFETIRFLIETISSIKSSLDSIGKDTSRKAINIQSISEQLIIIIDALKKFNDSNAHAAELLGQKIETLIRAVDELKSRMDVAEVKREHFGEKVAALVETISEIHIKTEVSAEALANIERYVVDSKDILLEIKVKNAFRDARVENKKELSFFAKVMEFIKNLDNVYKTILAIALFTALIATIFLKGNLADMISSIIKGLF